MRVVCFFFLFAAPFSPVGADPIFWISVGSFKTESKAAETAAVYRGRHSRDFSVVGSNTNRGFFYRVALGPYFSKSDAQSNLNTIKLRGLDSAWIWVERGGMTRTQADFNEDVSDELYRELKNYESKYDLDLDLDIPFDDSSVKEVKQHRSEEDDTESTEPPPGYQLNKLKRSAINVDLRAFDRVALALLDKDEYEEFEEEAYEISSAPTAVNLEEGKPIKLVRIKNADSNVKIDGRLDEAAWRELPGVDQFVVSEPDTLENPKYRTTVKAFYDDGGLYVAFDMEQPQETLVKRYSGRDNGRLNRDAVSITLDTSGEGRYGYWMNLALGGNQTDGTVLPEREFS